MLVASKKQGMLANRAAKNMSEQENARYSEIINRTPHSILFLFVILDHVTFWLFNGLFVTKT